MTIDLLLPLLRRRSSLAFEEGKTYDRPVDFQNWDDRKRRLQCLFEKILAEGSLLLRRLHNFGHRIFDPVIYFRGHAIPFEQKSILVGLCSWDLHG